MTEQDFNDGLEDDSMAAAEDGTASPESSEQNGSMIMAEQDFNDGLEDDSVTAVENGTASPESSERSRLSSVPVELTLNVGSLSLPLEQLLAMSEGQTFTSELSSFFPSVRLLASDRLVAEGELVRVDGHVGFRVTRLIG
ncbi:MAG: FliM/FliN family flagellar motor switch protein [Gammaproteobacteria bacterium]